MVSRIENKTYPVPQTGVASGLDFRLARETRGFDSLYLHPYPRLTSGTSRDPTLDGIGGSTVPPLTD